VRLNGELLWNKKQAGRFPEPKEIKQLIRDCIAPGKDLGHSDRK
jgi:selenoprotein W-related protein